MAITVDWVNKIILSTASITDLKAFHLELRDLEDSEAGMIHDEIHTWAALDLGGGAYFYAVDFVNGYQLKFPNPGNYVISGNLNATIIPVANVYVERRTSAAYITTSVGSSGSTPEQVADAVWAHSFTSKLLTVAKFLGLK